MSVIKIDLTGVDDFAKALAANLDGLDRATRAALLSEVEDHIGPASQMMVPFETGALRASMSVDDSALYGPGVAEIAVRYGEPYALIQHERLDFYHPSKRRGGSGPTAPGTAGGGPKYLEIPFAERVGRWPGVLIDSIRMRWHIVKMGGS